MTTISCGKSHDPAPLFEVAYTLAAEQDVFAYARISPDGNSLVFSSNTGPGVTKNPWSYTLQVLNLRTNTVWFSDVGIDGWWSNDGQRVIYRDQSSPKRDRVSIWHRATGEISRDVAPLALGDYFSWGSRYGRDLIVTIASHFYYLAGDRALLPAESVPPCPGIGVGDRPLVSRDGRRITTFVRGTIVVRDLVDCEYVFDTGASGAKADFSWGGRYIAFHIQKPDKPDEYEIDVVDLEQRTVRRVTAGLPGSSLFPSWTRDGRLCFRYQKKGFNGFMFATNVLAVPARPLSDAHHVAFAQKWSDIFPETRRPRHALTMVLVWSTWSAHSGMALAAAQRAHDWFRKHNLDVDVVTATDPLSSKHDADRALDELSVSLARIPLRADNLSTTEATNQVPSNLLFVGDVLRERRLGAQTFEQLRAWVANAGK